LGGRGTIAPADDLLSPTVTSRKLFQVSDSTGPLVVTEIARDSAINRNLLKSEDVFILDSGIEVYVWVGSKASSDEKKQGLSIAIKYLVDENRPPTTRISRLLEGGDNQEFLSLL
jgi:gelsolin